ncbi:transposase, Ptta/En/Spm [Tanacetum coccineum]
MVRSTFECGSTSGSVCGPKDELNTESSHARRRSNFIKQAPSDPSKRPMITLDGGWFTNTKREVVTDVLVCEVWEDTMKNRYPNIMLKARNELIKIAQLAGVQFDGSDFSVLKPYNPKWIESSYWEDMIDRVWNNAEWKMKSKSKRVNQLILNEVSKHCAGSITIVQHKRKLEKKLKTPLTTSEIFELTHTKKGAGNGLHEFMKLKAELVWVMESNKRRKRSKKTNEHNWKDP